MSNTRLRLEEWADGLSLEQLRDLAVTITSELIESETVGFHHGASSPYWTASGEDLVEPD